MYGEKGLNCLADFGYKGRACELTVAQQDALKNWVSQTLPRTTTIVGEWIEKSYGVSYTRSARCSARAFSVIDIIGGAD